MNVEKIKEKIKELGSSVSENFRAINDGKFFSTSLQTQLAILEILRNLFKRVGMVDNRLRVQDFSNKKVIETLDTYLQAVNERMSNVGLLGQKSFHYLEILLKHIGANGIKSETDFREEKDQQHIETLLIEFLFPWLKEKTAIDVGAKGGDLAGKLLIMGFKQVFALEPHPELASALVKNYEAYASTFQVFPYALSDKEGKGELHLVKASPDGASKDPRLFSTLRLHPLSKDLEWSDQKIPVEVRSLRDLIQEKILPSHAGLLKINTEGNDWWVLQGMPVDCQYEIVAYEFWGKDHVCHSSEIPQQENFTKYMRDIGYVFSLSIVHFPDGKLRFIVNMPVRIASTWGSTFCFRENTLFEKAYTFLSAILPIGYAH